MVNAVVTTSTETHRTVLLTASVQPHFPSCEVLDAANGVLESNHLTWKIKYVLQIILYYTAKKSQYGVDNHYSVTTKLGHHIFSLTILNRQS